MNLQKKKEQNFISFGGHSFRTIPSKLLRYRLLKQVERLRFLPQTAPGWIHKLLGNLSERQYGRRFFPSASEVKLKPIQESLSKLLVAVCGGAKIWIQRKRPVKQKLVRPSWKSDCKLLQSQNEMPVQKTETLENHSRKFNFRIFGVEQGKPTASAAKLLCDSFGRELVSSCTPHRTE